ncbi:L-asparaginase, partial [Amaricoccus sp. HAR-UPW-R2A-40]
MFPASRRLASAALLAALAAQPALAQDKPHVVIVATGGTIAGAG